MLLEVARATAESVLKIAVSVTWELALVVWALELCGAKQAEVLGAAAERKKERRKEGKKERKEGKKERRKEGKKERRKEGKKERRKEGKKERRKEGKTCGRVSVRVRVCTKCGAACHAAVFCRVWCGSLSFSVRGAAWRRVCGRSPSPSSKGATATSAHTATPCPSWCAHAEEVPSTLALSPPVP